MGLLSRAARRVGRFARGAGDEVANNWHWNRPGNTGAHFGVMGGLAGAALGQAGANEGMGSDPFTGALAGAALLGGGAAGVQATRAIAGGLARGISQMLRMAPHSGPEFEAAKAKVAQSVAQFAGDPSAPLLQGIAKQDAQAAAQRLMQARDADELLQIAEELERAGGNTTDALGGAYGMHRF